MPNSTCEDLIVDLGVANVARTDLDLLPLTLNSISSGNLRSCICKSVRWSWCIGVLCMYLSGRSCKSDRVRRRRAADRQNRDGLQRAKSVIDDKHIAGC
jgi:hypothetical protein